jgi:hypothetical protein
MELASLFLAGQWRQSFSCADRRLRLQVRGGLTDRAGVYDVLNIHVRLDLRELSEFSVEQYISKACLKTTAAETQQSNGESESD